MRLRGGRGLKDLLGPAAPYLTVLASVLLANAAYVTGFARLDPFITRSGMSVSITAGPLGGDYTIDGNDGSTAQALGRQAADQWLHGTVPWWNPHAGLGAPLVGGMQAASTFPLVILLALPAGFLIYHLLLDAIAGVATTAWLRTLGLSRTAATMAGVLYGLQGTLVWLVNAVSGPVPFLPVLLLGTTLASRGRRPVASIASIAAGVWLMLVAGFPEGAYLSGLFVALLMVWLWWRSRRRAAFVLSAVFGGALGVGLASPALVSFVHYLHSGAEVGHHVDGFAHLGLPASGTTMTLAPYSFGPLWQYARQTSVPGLTFLTGHIGGYTSAAVLLLALAGVLGRSNRGLRVLCAAWIVLAVLKTYDIPPLSGLLNLLPGIKQTAVLRYAAPTITLAVCVLAAHAVDDRRQNRRQLVVRVAAIAAIGAAIGVTWYAGMSTVRAVVARGAPGIEHWYTASYVWAVVSVAAVGGTLLMSARFRRTATAAAAVVVMIEAVVLFGLPSLSAPRSAKVDRQLVSFLDERARQESTGTDLSRVYTLSSTPFPNYGSFYGVTFVNVLDSPEPRLWVDFVLSRLTSQGQVDGEDRLDSSRLVARGNSAAYFDERLLDLHRHLDGFRSAGVAWVLVPTGVRLPDAVKTDLQLVERTALTSIYRLVGARPYFDDSSGHCRITSVSTVEARVDCSQSSTLIRRALFFDGWRATVNGRSSRISAQDTYFQSVAVPRGRSVVRFSYQPTGQTASEWIFVVCAVCFVSLLFVGMVRSRWRSGAHRPAQHRL